MEHRVPGWREVAAGRGGHDGGASSLAGWRLWQDEEGARLRSCVHDRRAMTAGKLWLMAGIGQQRDSGRESTAGKRWGRAKEAEEESREGDAERWRLGKDVKRGGRNKEPFGEGQAIDSVGSLFWDGFTIFT